MLVHFGVGYCANFLNIGQHNGVTWKDMITISISWVWDPVTRTCVIWLFRTNSWLTAGVFFGKSHVPIMVSNVLWDPWSQRTSQNVLWSSVLPSWFLGWNYQWNQSMRLLDGTYIALYHTGTRETSRKNWRSSDGCLKYCFLPVEINLWNVLLCSVISKA